MTDTAPVRTNIENWELQDRILFTKWYFKWGSLKKNRDCFLAYFEMMKAIFKT